jgi:hypothetical protein
VLVAWTPLSPSRREQGLRRAALALGCSTALILTGAALRDGSIEPAAALAALLAAAGGWLAGRQAREAPIDIGVDESGCIVGRRLGTAHETPEHLRCVFAAPWLITLKSGTIWVRIWPDSVSGNIFRRLWVHIRWNPGRQPTDRSGATAPAPPG